MFLEDKTEGGWKNTHMGRMSKRDIAGLILRILVDRENDLINSNAQRYFDGNGKYIQDRNMIEELHRQDAESFAIIERAQAVLGQVTGNQDG